MINVTYWIRLYTFIVLLTLANSIKSEGTKQLAPNANIVITGSQTTDIAALNIDSPSYNNFASRKNKNPESRLYVHISDPSTECIFLGFSAPHIKNGGELQDIEYWVLDPNGKEIISGVKLFNGDAEIDNWDQAVMGPQQLVGPDGYNATYISSEDLISKGWTGAGDYYIEFKNRSSGFPFLIDYFDITVASCEATNLIEKPGRVWAYNWALFSINDFGFPNRPFNGAFFICAPDTYDESKSFITKIDFNGSGFQPGAFNFAFNSFGTDTTGVISIDRQSVENRNRTYWEYPIYLNDPVDICEEAEIGDAQIKSIRRCDGVGFEFGVYIKGHSQVEFLLDFDRQDGLYRPNSKDIVISENFEFEGIDTLVYLTWDGFDGLGNNYNKIEEGEIPTKLLFGQTPFHFPIYDGEYLFKGISVENVRPQSANPLLLFYDDSKISEEPGNGNSQIELVGCDSPCHGWNNYLNPNAVGYGNKNTINTWWYAHQIQEDKVFDIPSYYSCQIDGGKTICGNDTIRLLVRPRLFPLDGDRYPITGVKWIGPNIVGSDSSNIVNINGGGEYTAELFWVNDDDVECSTSCSYFIEDLPYYEVSIDTLITLGDEIKINSQYYSSEGSYVQELTAQNGCDSILTVNVEVFVPDVLLRCELVGQNAFCINNTLKISSVIEQDILQEFPLGIISKEWSGPEIIENNVDDVVISGAGEYIFQVRYYDLNDNELTTECSVQIDALPIYNDTINIEMFRGETFTFNNIEYTSEGHFVDSLKSVNNCDSIINIFVDLKELPVLDQFVLFDLENCKSSDYDKLTPQYEAEDDCVKLNVSNLYRENPGLNAHSCTQGIDGGSAICISSDDTVEYNEHSDKHLRFNMLIEPKEGRVVKLNTLTFFEKSPEVFLWTIGEEGLNNFPNKFAITIRINDSIVYQRRDEPSTRNWKFNSYDLNVIGDFTFCETTEVEFSMLAYDLVGNNSNVSAWEVDEVQVVYTCERDTTLGIIQGQITDVFAEPVESVMIQLTNEGGDAIAEVSTNKNGEYAFDSLIEGNAYFANASFQVDPLENVSTLDLLHIQRHILGLNFFDKPLQYIAADINFDNKITAEDLLELRKLLLGINENFQDDQSCLFVSNYENLGFDNVWDHNSEDFIKTGEQLDLKYIKMGDVIQSKPKKRSQSNFFLDFEIQKNKNTNSQELLISMENLADCNAFQFELDLNDKSINEVEILDAGVMYSVNSSSNSIIVQYLGSDQIKNNNELLSITFDSQFKFDKIKLLNEGIHAEAYTSSDVFSLELRFLQKTDFQSDDFGIWPNPFDDKLYFNLDSEVSSSVDLSIIDLNGKIICAASFEIKIGKNQCSILDKCDIELNGIYFIQVKQGNWVYMDKIISY